MKRRRFLKTTLASAGAIFLTSGCASGSNDTGADSQGEDLIDGSLYFPQSVASGDPKPTSVIIWTRVADTQNADKSLEVELQLALDSEFSKRVELNGGDALVLTADTAFDHCVKVRVTDLSPATIYYYRFVYRTEETLYTSRIGRTKTAPEATADVAVRFGFLSCQDFNGKYYNTHARLAAEDLDFWVHLGDYIYETTGNPSFQDVADDRRTTFSDPTGAIVFNEGKASEYYAATRVEHYRDLYKTYRTDVDLQALHERAPMIAVWDDHEFSDDSYGATATYYSGRKDEFDVDRRKAANQAWFEYMPVDYMDSPDFKYSTEADFPGDIQIYRDFVYGKNMHLVMTDLRSYRSAHPVAGDALPGAVILEQSDLETLLGDLPEDASAYVDIDAFQDGKYAQAIKDAAETLDHAAANVTGLVTVPFINSQISQLADAGGTLASISEDQTKDLPRGYAYTHLGKRESFSSLGSRYLIGKTVYDLFTTYRYEKTNGESELAMGKAQQDWFLKTMKESQSVWKIWGNEYCLSPLQVDLTTADLPDDFKKVFYLNAEDWNSQRNRRSELITELHNVDNVVAITGDIHAFYAGTPMANDDPEKKVVEFVGGGASSGTFKTLLVRYAESDPTLKAAGAVQLALLAEFLLTDKYAKVNPHLGYAKMDRHGCAIAELDGDRMEVTYLSAHQDEVTQRMAAQDLDSKFLKARFKVKTGSRELYMDVDGAWKRWNPETCEWV